jgi:hypothetical protein
MSALNRCCRCCSWDSLSVEYVPSLKEDFGRMKKPKRLLSLFFPLIYFCAFNDLKKKEKENAIPTGVDETGQCHIIHSFLVIKKKFDESIAARHF